MRRTIKGVKCTEYYYPVDGKIALPLELKKELGTIRVKCSEQSATRITSQRTRRN